MLNPDTDNIGDGQREGGVKGDGGQGWKMGTPIIL